MFRVVLTIPKTCHIGVGSKRHLAKGMSQLLTCYSHAENIGVFPYRDRQGMPPLTVPQATSGIGSGKQPFGPVDGFVQLLDCVRVIRTLQRQRLGVCDHPVLPDSVDQFGQSQLAIPQGLTDTVFNDPALKVNRLSGGWREVNTARVLQDPPHLG
jgi:hypothetical protein